MRCAHFAASIDRPDEVRTEVDAYGQISLFAGDPLQYEPTVHLIITPDAARAIVDALHQTLEQLEVAR